MSYRGFATTVAALVVPIAVSVTWRSTAAPPRTITGSTASVPKEAQHWIEPGNGAIRQIDPTAYCRDVLASPELQSTPLTPAAGLDRVTKDVAARLAFRRDLRLRGSRLEDVRLGTGMSEDYPVPEILLRVVPFEALVAYVDGSYTRVYALAEPLDVAVDRLRARIEAVAPRVACALRPTHVPWNPRYSRVHEEGNARIVDVLVPVNSCEPGSYFTVRLFRPARGDVTYLVSSGQEAFEDDRFVDVDSLAVAALSR